MLSYDWVKPSFSARVEAEPQQLLKVEDKIKPEMHLTVNSKT